MEKLLNKVNEHGIQIFVDINLFTSWLSKPNFYFNGKPPLVFNDTIKGLKFIDDRLTAMEYGDN